MFWLDNQLKMGYFRANHVVPEGNWAIIHWILKRIESIQDIQAGFLKGDLILETGDTLW